MESGKKGENTFYHDNVGIKSSISIRPDCSRIYLILLLAKVFTRGCFLIIIRMTFLCNLTFTRKIKFSSTHDLNICKIFQNDESILKEMLARLMLVTDRAENIPPSWGKRKEGEKPSFAS